jgi:hypothetical protein
MRPPLMYLEPSGVPRVALAYDWTSCLSGIGLPDKVGQAHKRLR